MSLNGGLSLGFVFTARDLTGPAMRSVQRNFNQLDKNTNKTTNKMSRLQGSVGGVAMASAAAATSAATLGGALKSALDAGRFEQELIRANAIVNGTATTMQDIRDTVMKNAMETQFTPEETLTAFKEIATRGFNAKESMQSLASALDLATVGGIKVEQSAALMSASLRAFSMDASQAEQVTNSLAKAAFTSGISITELDIAVSNAARGAQLANQSMQTTLSSIGLIKNQGGYASTAGTQFSILTEKLAQHREKVKKLFDVDVADADGNFRDAQAVTYELMENAIKKYTNEAERAAVLREVFERGAKAATAIHGQLKKGVEGQDGIIRYGFDAINYRNEQILNSKGFLAKAKDELLDTFAGQADLLKGILGGIAVEVGQVFGSVLKPLVTEFISVGKTVLEFFAKMNPETKKILATVVLLGAALTTIVTTGGALVATIAYVAPLVSAGIAAFGAALPWIAGVTAAVALLSAGFYGLKKAYDKNLGGFGETIRDKFNKVRMAFDGIIQLFTKGKITGRTAKDLKDPNNAPVLRFLNLVVKWGFRARAFIIGFVERMKDRWRTLEPHFRRLSRGIALVGKQIDNLVQTFTKGTPSVKSFTSDGIKAADVTLAAFGATVTLVSGYFEAWNGWVAGIGEELSKLDFKGMKEDANKLGTELEKIMVKIGASDGYNTEDSGFAKIGRVLGWLAGTGLRMAGHIVGYFIKYFAWMGEEINWLTDQWDYWVTSFFDGRMRQRIIDWWDGVIDGFKKGWSNMIDWLESSFDRIILKMVSIGKMLPQELRPEGFDNFLNGLADSAGRRTSDREAKNQAYRDSIQTSGIIPQSAIKAFKDNQAIYDKVGPSGTPSPLSEGMSALSNAVRAGMEAALGQQMKKKDDSKPIQVETAVKLDGTILGRAMYALSAKNQALGFGGDQTDEND